MCTLSRNTIERATEALRLEETMTCPTQSKYNVSTIPPFTQQQDSKGEVESLRDELEFQKVLERARKRIAQKEYYTPEEAYKITMQSIREVYAI